MMQDKIMEVAKEAETINDDSIESDKNNAIEAGEKNKSTVEVDEKKRKNGRDGERKRGEKNSKVQNHLKKKKIPRKFTCNKCDREFAGVSSLKNHEVKHVSAIGGGQFKCGCCGMFLTKKIGLKRHMHDVHNSERILMNVNMFLKDNRLVRSKDEVLKGCVGDSEAFKKVFVM